MSIIAQRMAQAAAVAAAIAIISLPAKADLFNVTVEAPGVQNTTATFSVSGVETFDGRPLGTHTFATDFGTGGVLTGTFTGVPVAPADEFGGAGGTGNYAALESDGLFTLTLDQNLTYFGLWISALNATNTLSIYNGDMLVESFDPADLIALVQTQPDYYGNPNPQFLGADPTQPFAFVNFYDTDGSFNRIVVAGPGYESDNFTVGLFTDQTGTPVGVPEPASLALLGTGLAGLGLVGRRKVF